jgi:two-component system NtrC family sensor kinase
MTLRNKITVGSILILLVSFAAVAVVISYYMNKVYLRQVQIRIRHDLFSAHQIYEDYVERVDDILQAVAIRRRMTGTLEKEIEGDLGNVFRSIYANSGLDILTLVDVNGKVIFRAHNPEKRGDVIAGNPLLKKVLESWEPVRGTVVVPAEMLAMDGDEILKRVAIDILPTPMARESHREKEDRGMFIAAAVPVYSLHDDAKLGILMGGYLLNRNHEIVDNIKEEVFGAPDYGGPEVGTATIFFDDLRISTNVLFENQERAIGSRLSEEVYDHVIKSGNVWSDLRTHPRHRQPDHRIPVRRSPRVPLQATPENTCTGDPSDTQLYRLIGFPADVLLYEKDDETH